MVFGRSKQKILSKTLTHIHKHIQANTMDNAMHTIERGRDTNGKKITIIITIKRHSGELKKRRPQ